MSSARAACERERAGPSKEQVRLTPRETELLRLMDRGLRNKEIASLLDLSLSTVKNHVHNILSKLDVPRRSALSHRITTSQRQEGALSERSGLRRAGRSPSVRS